MDTGERAPRASGRGLARDMVAMVALGTALGVLFNGLQLASGPRRGLSWVPEDRPLARLEAVAPALPLAHVDSAAMARAVAVPVSPPATAVHAPAGPHAVPAPRVPATGGTVRHGPATGPGPGAMATAAPPATAAPADPPRAAALPVIPDTREPLEIQLDTIQKFWGARAALIVDARPADEYAAGHIAGAVNLPFDDVLRNPDLAKRLDTRGRTVVISYCGGGSCELAKELASSLIEAGHRKVLVFTGGFPAWQESGGAVETGPGPGTP